METSRNRAKVMAIILRAATQVLRGRSIAATASDAIESIDSVAEELETIAATPVVPDPEASRG